MSAYMEWLCLWLDAWQKWVSGMFSSPEIPAGRDRAPRRRGWRG